MIPEIRHYQDALHKHEKLNPNMRLVARLYQLLRDERSDIGDIANLIASDGALTAKLLSLCNSAYFGSGKRISDIPSAIQSIGLREVTRLVGTIVAGQLFMRDLGSYGMSADDYWGQSIYCAIFLEKASANFGLDPSEAYLIGLLHAIGRVVINEMLLDREVEIFWDPTLPADTWERIMAGRPYDEAGADLLARWKLPESIVTVIKSQNDPAYLQHNRCAALLHFTRSLVEANRWDFAASFWELPADESLYKRLGTEPTILQNLHQQTLQALNELRQNLSSETSRR